MIEHCFRCPYCGCTEIPSYVDIFPPYIVECKKCSGRTHENQFFKEKLKMKKYKKLLST